MDVFARFAGLDSPASVARFAGPGLVERSANGLFSASGAEEEAAALEGLGASAATAEVDAFVLAAPTLVFGLDFAGAASDSSEESTMACACTLGSRVKESGLAPKPDGGTHGLSLLLRRSSLAVRVLREDAISGIESGEPLQLTFTTARFFAGAFFTAGESFWGKLRVSLC